MTLYTDHDPQNDALSINKYCERLPRRRDPRMALGKLLRFPRTGLIGVLIERKYPSTVSSRGGWEVVVVRADRHGVYQPDGYRLYVGDGEVETADEVDLSEVPL